MISFIHNMLIVSVVLMSKSAASPSVSTCEVKTVTLTHTLMTARNLVSSTIISSTTIVLSVLIPLLVVIIIVRHHPAKCHTSKHTRSGSHRKTTSHSHTTTALSPLRLAIHLLLPVSTTVSAAHHRLLSVHGLLSIAASHHRLLTVALLRISASAVVLLLRRSRASAASKLRGDLGEEAALLFARWQLALLAVGAWAAHARLL
jgi:hypothetical protein